MSGLDRLLLAAPRHLVDQIAMGIAAAVLLLGALLLLWLAVKIGRLEGEEDPAELSGSARE